MTTEYLPTQRTEFQKVPTRGSYDRDLVHAIIDQSIVCHVGASMNNTARVIPMAILRIGEYVYLHGSNTSQLLRSLADGAEVCITVSIIDALVAARSGFHCAVDYRSVVLFAKGEEVRDRDEKMRILDGFIQHMVPGHKVREPKGKEINATAVIRFPLVEASAKVRDTGVSDFEEDQQLDSWAGVIPLKIVAGDPVDSPTLKAGVKTPEYVKNFTGWRAVR